MNIDNVLLTLFVFTVSVLVLLIIRAIFFRLLHRWAEKTETEIDNIVITSIRFPSIFLSIGLGIYIGLETSELPSKYSVYLVKLIHVLIIFAATVAIANLGTRLFISYIDRKAISVQSSGLLNTIIRISIYALGLIIILNSLGISIAPLITALGIGGLAIGLALRDTLENLFAGIHIMTEKTIRIGDFIRLESGQEGFVEDISWRTTRIRMIPNNMIIIPNSKLAQSIVLNYSLPEKRLSIQIPISVSYGTDPEKVERVLLEEVTKAASDIPAILTEPAPVVRFIPGFGENSLNFTLICHISEVTEQFVVQSELRKRILKRFNEEGIEIPFPQRVVWLKSDIIKS